MFTDDLLECLNSGFVNEEIIPYNNSYEPKLLVNDKLSGRKVLSTLLNELDSCNNFWMSTAFVTKSGVATIINKLDELNKKNIPGRILVSQYQNFTQPEALRSLLKFNNIQLKIATRENYHAKGYCFLKNSEACLIIGSSNLTANALCLNKEWNLKISSSTNGKIVKDVASIFETDFKNAEYVTDEFIEIYEEIYRKHQSLKILPTFTEQIKRTVTPNSMQIEALKNIKKLRESGKDKALLISATGTGKTYLSAFDVKEINPSKCLFIVHRLNIAKAALVSYREILGQSIKAGLYSGEHRDTKADFIFSTIQTLSKDEHLSNFTPDYFEYIVIDETHRAGGDTYKKILNYFKPRFLLGMTATPERTDGFDIFKQFDYNIAYEIRLQQALEEDMLSPFHYYGVSEISINGELLSDNATINQLTMDERVNRIIEKVNFYGCDDGVVRGLVFCSNVDECKQLSKMFNKSGFKTISITGENSEDERALAINQLESDNEEEKIDYIFTVDVFNEGIDIPRVNQIVMLRPTQSAIIFVQQLGRGLRKINNKEFLTVIDFIGNYNNNYLVPIALYGDSSYNQDTLRKLMSSGSSLIPGSSTINFDEISKHRIFAAIDQKNMKAKMDLVNDYKLLKYKIGRIPLMVDFLEHGSRDPYLYVDYASSFYNFIASVDSDEINVISERKIKLLELLSCEIANSKRIEEVFLLNMLCMNRSSISINDFKKQFYNKYGIKISDETLSSIINNLNFCFIKDDYTRRGKNISFTIVNIDSQLIELDNEIREMIEDDVFMTYLNDIIHCAFMKFDKDFIFDHYVEGFILYKKYSRKDVFRILNWNKNPVAQNVGGYIISNTDKQSDSYNCERLNCPIFVNYEKDEAISGTTKYHDHFINNIEFEWMSKSRRNLSSKDVIAIRQSKQNGMRIPLFIKKSNDEGLDFYYMGDVIPMDESFEESSLLDDNGKAVSVVKMKFIMKQPVELNIYNYLTSGTF